MSPDFKPYSFKTNHGIIHPERPLIMGILNSTQDSFFDGGKFHTTDKALRHCDEMLKQGADIIDVGGQSTRPGAEIVSLEDEKQATAPLIDAIRKRFPDTLISIDTFRAGVAKAALDHGADWVNDVSAGDDDPEMIPLIAERKCTFIAMHKKGHSKNMQINPQYQNVCEEVLEYFKQKMAVFNQQGIHEVIVDPGFGFGKTLEHNYSLMKHLDLFHALNLPVLVGISRKTMVWKLLETNPEGALNGTTSLNTVALLKGAHILRVHDVREAVECARIVEKIRLVN